MLRLSSHGVRYGKAALSAMPVHSAPNYQISPVMTTATHAMNFTDDTQHYLTCLNAEQRQAVETLDGPLLVLAGAGTGKTRVLTTRIAHLLMSKKAFSGQILAVTFTNKAAKEMVHRVEAMIGGSAAGMWLGTFHSIGVRILRRHAEKLGFSSQFSILDMDDQIRLIKQVMEEMKLDVKRWPPKAVAHMISGVKDKGLLPEQCHHLPEAGYVNGRLPDIYAAYQKRMLTISAMDFGDLLLHCLTLFQKYPEVLTEYHHKLRYILVDEYQDTNIAQYLWLRLLAMRTDPQTGKQPHNICCVGDDDQSIYGWRGAEVGNILKFEKDFPEAVTIRLECNYRSTAPILHAASTLIANNEERLGKTLWTPQDGGDLIRVHNLWDDGEEAGFVADQIEQLQRQQVNLDEVAILVRAGHQTRSFEEKFMRYDIPYRVVGGLRFYERKEIKDMIAYLRVTLQPHDDMALERIINTPKRGIGDSSLDKMIALAHQTESSLYDTMFHAVAEGSIAGKAGGSMAALLKQFEGWRTEAAHLSPPDMMEKLLDESGYLAMLKAEATEEARGRMENLKELVQAMTEFDDLQAFMEHVGLVMDREMQDHQQAMVTLMTLHASKGLEYDYVFLPGWEEGLFPNQRAMDETGKKGLEEERRLAYVGITRARKHLTISHASNRRMYNQWQSCIPSRFLDELPADAVQVEEAIQPSPMARGGFGGSRSGHGWGAARGMGASRQQLQQSIDDLMQSYGRQNGAAAERPKAPTNQSHEFPAGTKVVHKTFGDGTVLSAEGDKLQICFVKAGIKKLMKDFVEKR